MSLFDGQHTHIGGPDSTFESFIESDLILDVSSPAPVPSTPVQKKESKSKPSSLSALPPRLSLSARNTPGSPGPMSEYLTYTHSSGSTVTTPTTSNSSSLHNLNFDFFEGSDGGANSANQSVSDVISSPQTGLRADGKHPSEQPFALKPVPSDGLDAATPLFGADMTAMMSDMPLSTELGHPIQPFNRSVDDMGHSLGQPVQHHPAHHQRSLSLRDVAPVIDSMHPSFYPGPGATPFTFASGIKMEADIMAANMAAYDETSPSTMDRSSPSSSALASSLFDRNSPPQEKKRRISKSKVDGGKGGTGKGASGTKKVGAGNRRKSSIKDDKAPTSVPECATVHSAALDAASLIENRQVQVQAAAPRDSVERDSSFACDETMDTSMEPDTSGSVSASVYGDDCLDDGDADTSFKRGTKRPPPSASQITEAGMPFPVIDTSAKHSSLFVPPDTSGLTKREARLVKNRAAAFLSRQRKREQFEELEIKCRNLCRLVWKMWQLGTEAANGKKGAQKNSPFADNVKLSGALLEHEGAEVQEVFDTVLMLKGGSVAPTEDGQLQGAVAAGLKSANGKLIDDAGSVISVPSSAAQAAEEASRELARLRSELDEHRKREASLQAELAHERALRMKVEFDAKQREQERRPFRNGGGQGDLSLTVPATFEDDMEEEEEDGEEMKVAELLQGNGKDSMLANGNMKRPRSSQRLQRQNIGTPAVASNAQSQRKAASAALMMVLFSFALFGMPGGEMGGGNKMMGGISRVPGSSSDAFPLGRVLTAPITGAGQLGEDEEEAAAELNAHLPPSSHLSFDDLFSSTQQLQDLLEEEAKDADQRGSRKGASMDFSMDYKAFAKDLSSSLDWDMQRGFLVLGAGDDDREDGAEDRGESQKARSSDGMGVEAGDAPTKLTLFVPAPLERSASPDADGSEDRFYDAPLAAASASDGAETDGSSETGSAHQRELTQADATRAALQVLRNHRVAREAAAFAASRHETRKPSPSRRAGTPPRSSSASDAGGKDVKVAFGQGREEDDEEDFSQDMQQNSGSTTADQIRGKDFYQLEFSLSGAKVRNVAELARLFGSMRNKRVE